jgi:hypothetical protein
MDLKEVGEFGVSSARGRSWLQLGRLPRSGASVGMLNIAFAPRRRLRVELYIDTGDQNANKVIFDALHMQRPAVEQDFGGSLTWERLDNRRASRVANYRAGAITDDQEHLDELRRWAITTVQQLEGALRKPLADATAPSA